MNPALDCASARIKSQRVSSGEHNSTRFRDSEADHDIRKLYGPSVQNRLTGHSIERGIVDTGGLSRGR